MEIKFISEGRSLDLSGKELSVSESNSMISDKMFTKYLFPFDFYMDDQFKREFGDYSSFDAFNLPKTISGQILYENSYRLAKLNILGCEGNYLTCQIDFGFEEIPNFDKQLKELPLEKYPVDNIHTFAANIAGQLYPQTNFNFPRLYTAQFSPNDTTWDAFNGYINDMNNDGTALKNNYTTDDGEIYNVNIVHPMPHILYLLKTGFQDAGYQLGGEILTDPLLQNLWVYSATEYFSRLTLRKLGLLINVMDYEEEKKFLFSIWNFGVYNKTVKIPKPGNYRLIANVRLNDKGLGVLSFIKIKLGNNLLLNRSVSGALTFTFETDISTISENEELNVTGFRALFGADIEYFCELTLVSKNTYENEENTGEDNGVITNLNQIDLTRAVPEITFGELLNRVRNFFNYDVELVDNTIVMNRIRGAKKNNIKVVPEKFLALEPQVEFSNKNSFLIKMPDWENEEKPDSVYYDETGVIVNKEAGELTTTIETNTYALPVYVALPRGQETGVVKSYSTNLLQLVKYNGKTGIQNNAKPAPELTFPTLFYTNWVEFLRERLNSGKFTWTFIAEDDELNFTIKDELSCYQNIHRIKEWIKDYYENSMQVQIVTETIS